MSWVIMRGDARRIPLRDGSVQCVVTSPPYWGLRDYGIEPSVWGGEDHEHEWKEHIQPAANGIIHDGGMSGETLSGSSATRKSKHSSFCPCGAWLGVLGLEPTIDLYIDHMVEIFGEVRRVLRKDGTVWLNLGDSYAANRSYQVTDSKHINVGNNHGSIITDGLKPKDLCGIPWRVALALQADGWWLRSDIIWSKPNPMPESVNGWRWERHRVKVSGGNRGSESQKSAFNSRRPQQDHNGKDFKSSAAWEDCPGCSVCKLNDGLVLRKGSWRPSTSHEYLFMLTKSDNYFCDAEAVRETRSENTHSSGTKWMTDMTFKTTEPGSGNRNNRSFQSYMRDQPQDSGRNLRSVWEMTTQPYPEAHFATFPESLPERCIMAGTSEKGCCRKCGSPWVRVMEKNQLDESGSYGSNTPGKHSRMFLDRDPQHSSKLKRQKKPTGGDNDDSFPSPKTIGWRPSCRCNAGDPVSCRVLDPFSGAGTTVLVADKLGRYGIGIDLKAEYSTMARNRVFNDAPLLSTARE